MTTLRTRKRKGGARRGGGEKGKGAVSQGEENRERGEKWDEGGRIRGIKKREKNT